MPSNRDPNAARRIHEMRLDRGLTPEDLAYLTHKANPRYAVSGRTIRRIEKTGAIPTVRVMFGIAAAFELLPSELWAGGRVGVAR